jgi:hypothetical protein
MSDRETISWRDALKRIIEMGHARDTAPTMLVEAIDSNAIGYYPRRALRLGPAHQAGLLNPETGAWRMHRGDTNPLSVRPIRSEFEHWLVKLRQPSKAGSEIKAVPFLSDKLKVNPDLTRKAAWTACKGEFPNLSERRFVSRVWPEARVNAGLERDAPAGRKKQKP